MKINGTSNNSFQNKVLLDTFIDQISALQTDVGNLQIADNNLANDIATKASTADLANAVNTRTLGAQTGNIKTLKVQGTGSNATIENATIGNASIGTENVTQSNITNLEVMDVDAGTVRAGTLTVENDATVSGDLSVQDISAKDITSASVNTLNLTAAESTVTSLQSDTANVTNKLTVKDLEVNGDFTGVSSIDTEDIDTDNIKAKTAEVTETLKAQNTRDWLSQVMNRTQILPTPSPQLEPVDRYTIELPRFNGVYLLSWESGASGIWSEEQGAYITEPGNVVWTATVIGNGKSYGISWGSRTEENFITDLFQCKGKLYIRINSNGALKCAYSATEELPNPTIYFNMVGWTQDKSLEELCDERSHLINAYPTGTAWFGNTFIPRLENVGGNGINFKGSCLFNNLPNPQDSQIGDVWNITDEAYTDARFIGGAGKPINAGDDVVAVVVDVEVIPYSESFGEDYDFFGAYYVPETGKVLLSSHNCIYQRNDDNTVTLVQELNGNDNLVLKKFVKAGSKLYCLNNEYVYPFAYSEDNGETWALEDSFWWDYANPVNMVQAGNKIIIYSGSESNYSSDDDGNTWTATDLTLDDNNDFSFYSGDTVCQLANGKILGIQPRGRYNQETNTYSALVCMSDDGINFTSIPRTWYDDVESVLHYTSNKYPWLTQLSNGTILAGCTFTKYMPGTLPNIDTSKIIKSTDNGVTWSLFYEFGDYRIGGEHPYTYRPTVYSVVELEDGTLYAVGTYLISKDFGNTWEIISEDLDTFASYNPIYPCVKGMNVIVPHGYDRTGGTRLYLESRATNHEMKWDKFAAGVSITVVDTVADGNMNAVTSNAVYDYIDAAITQVLNTGF